MAEAKPSDPEELPEAAFRLRPDCEICGEGPGRILCEMPFESGPVADFITHYYHGRIDPQRLRAGTYVLRRCGDCDFLWQGEVLDEAWLETLYETWIDADESLAKSEDRTLRDRMRLIHQIAIASCVVPRPQTALRALDFGMGWGGWCESARALGVRVAAAELSERRVTHGRARGIEVLNGFPVPGRSFDLVNAEQVFEHVADPLPTLRLLAAHLAPSGVLRVSVPDARSFLRKFRAGRWKPGKDALHPLEHVNGFTPSSLARLAAMAGLVPLGPGRLLGASARAAGRSGSLAPRDTAEILHGHFLGVARWFEHDGNHGGR